MALMMMRVVRADSMLGLWDEMKARVRMVCVRLLRRKRTFVLILTTRKESGGRLIAMRRRRL